MPGIQSVPSKCRDSRMQSLRTRAPELQQTVQSDWKSLSELNEKTTELLPLLVNKGGAVLHCGLWKRAGKAVSLSTRSIHTPWLVPTGPTHRPVIMWLSALFRTVRCLKGSCFCNSRTTKNGSATGYMLSILVCKREAAWCGRKVTGLDVKAPSQMGH